jgi:hypothetical protein
MLSYGKSRDNYATFMSDSPYLAAAPTPDNIFPDEVGVVTPFVVKPKKLIEYEDKYTRQNKVKPGSTLSFDKFEFDRQAQNLSPGEVLVARDVHDVGPRAVVTGPDDPKYFSYALMFMQQKTQCASVSVQRQRSCREKSCIYFSKAGKNV